MYDLPFGDAMQCDAFNLAMGQGNEKIRKKKLLGRVNVRRTEFRNCVIHRYQTW